MKKILVITLMAWSVSLLGAGDAQAQRKDDWMTGIYLGYTASVEEDAPSGDLGGLFYATYFVHDVISVGGDLGIFRLGSQDIDDPVLGKATISQHIFELTADVRVTGSGKFKPFANAGLGPYWVTTNGSALDGFVGATGTQARFGFNLGGGIIFGGASSKWSFGLDARWHSIVKGNYDESALDMVSILVGFNVRE
jgi:hypothetical protein